MKKILVLFAVFLLTTCDVFAAAYSVRYSPTGARMSVTRGTGLPRSLNRYGSNALFLPQNAARAGRASRMVARQKAVTRAIRAQALKTESEAFATINNSIGANGNNIAALRGSSAYSGARTLSQASTAPAEVSRFSRNYKIPTQKTYTRNGVTYYN